LQGAPGLEERITDQIASSGKPRVTGSAGVAVARGAQENAEQVMRRSDASLYCAKTGGRNRVEVASETPAVSA